MPLVAFFIAVHTRNVLFQCHFAQCLASSYCSAHWARSNFRYVLTVVCKYHLHFLGPYSIIVTHGGLGLILCLLYQWSREWNEWCYRTVMLFLLHCTQGMCCFSDMLHNVWHHGGGAWPPWPPNPPSSVDSGQVLRMR